MNISSLMVRISVSIYLLLASLILLAQSELNYPTATYTVDQIKANWVSHPAIEGGEDRIILFRNSFEITDTAQDYIINISADNHYFLYVNGTMVTHGPQLSDIKHWKYETLNLKDYLQIGPNVIAVKVINFGKRRFLGMQSIYTSLMVNGVTENAKNISTTGQGDTWRCTLDDSYHAIEVNWRGGGPKSIVGGFYANNPTDYVDMNRYPTGWTDLGYDDSMWTNTLFFEGASSMGGSIAYLLEPRSLPLLTWEPEAIGSVVRSSTQSDTHFPSTGKIDIPSHQKMTFLIDQKYVTNGFPELNFSGGKHAQIKIKYAENLFGENNEKGDRNEIENKTLLGYHDIIISNGMDAQQYIPNWMRTWRFIEFEIETADEALTLERYINHRSRTAIPSTAHFKSDNENYNAIFDICKRTVDICTQDYFLSDAYYETMQYVGDTKIQALLWQAMSGSLAHTENAIEQFHQSRDAEGNILGAYPLRSTFIYPTYSLVWVDMIHDYYELTGDTTFIHRYKDGIIHTLAGFEKNMNELHLVNKTKYRYFIDWYTGPQNGSGTATNNDGENSAVVSLHYVHALQSATQLFTAIGAADMADQYHQRATEIKASVFELCYDSERRLFAERPDQTIYDQHTNIMAVLTDAIEERKQKALLEKILEEEDLLQATYYYRYYLFEAIKKVDAPELFDLAQRPWETMISDHMTTTLERFESKEKPTRSEVHPWSASPAYFYFHYLAGITSVQHDFEEIQIKPAFGRLQSIEGMLPTSKGEITFNLERSKTKLRADITIPKQMKGVIIWNGKRLPLTSGQNRYTIE